MFRENLREVKEKKTMKKTFLLMATGLVSSLLLAGCVESYQTTTVQGVVVEKEHEEASIKYKTVTTSDGQTKKKLVREEEEFDVVIQYKEIQKEFEFEDDTFYKKVNVGDKVNVHLVTGHDGEGKVVTQDIDLIIK